MSIDPSAMKYFPVGIMAVENAALITIIRARQECEKLHLLGSVAIFFTASNSSQTIFSSASISQGTSIINTKKIPI
jgi:hypothetical protein